MEIGIFEHLSSRKRCYWCMMKKASDQKFCRKKICKNNKIINQTIAKLVHCGKRTAQRTMIPNNVLEEPILST
jgi:hypothetical protein